MPGEATEVGSIVGYLILNRSDWVAGVRETKKDSDQLGRLNPHIRIDTNADRVIAQLALVDGAARRIGNSAEKAQLPVVGLWQALALVAPAAAPIGAVAGGALLGLIPTAAAVVLGVKGIENQMKAGALQGSQFADQVDQLKSEISGLEQIAGNNLMGGLTKALQSSQPLFATVNQDVAMMSHQLGDIVASAAPALLNLLTQLNPLFVTFGNQIAAGAQHFEHWAQTSSGVSKFVAYVQQELPNVEHLLGSLLTLIGHLAEASTGTGDVLVQSLTAIANALNAIPLDVLRVMIPLLVTGRLAFLGFAAVKPIWDGITAAIKTTRTTIGEFNQAGVAALAEQRAAMLQSEADTARWAAQRAEVAAAMARIAANEAADAQAAARAVSQAFGEEADAADLAVQEIAAAFGRLDFTFGTQTEVVNSAPAEFADAMEAEAAAAQAAAAEIGAAAQAAADESAAAAAEASVSWTAMLGPLGLLVGGIALLSLTLSNDGEAAMAAADAMHSYADSVKQSTDALNAANIAQTNKNLSDQGALTLLDQLHGKNQLLGLSYADLTQAVNGSDSQFRQVQQTIFNVAKSQDIMGGSAFKLLVTLGTMRQGLFGQIKTQLDYNKVAQQTADVVATQQQVFQSMTDTIARAANVATQTGSAFLQAFDAFGKSSGTAADRAAIIGATLKAANGDALAYAGALTSVTSAIDALTGAFQQQKQQLAQQSAKQQAAAAAETVAQARVAAAQARVDQVRNSSKHTAAQLAAAEAALASAQASAANAASKAAQQGALAYADTERAALRFTGAGAKVKASIDVNAKGAAQLVQQLQGIQNAAMQAAEALYQHEVATKGGRQAADDAYQLYKNETQKALVDSAKLLGINSDQARALAKDYFDMPKQVKTLIESEGTDPIVAVLNKIGKLLADLVGEPWDVKVNVSGDGLAKVSALQAKLTTLTGRQQNVGASAPGHNAAGTSDWRGGLTWVGERGPELVDLPPHSRVYPHDVSTRMANGAQAKQIVQVAKIEQNIYNPVAEPVSLSGPANLRRAAMALGR